jgi:hypothetical protein
MRPACADRGCQPEEKWYALTGRVVDAKVEADGDIHLALQDADGKNAGTVSAEIPVGPKWCEIRQIVFGWTKQKFPFTVKSVHDLTIAEHVVTVTGKAFYDIAHAPADHSNRRTSPKDYAVWEIHPVNGICAPGAMPQAHMWDNAFGAIIRFAALPDRIRRTSDTRRGYAGHIDGCNSPCIPEARAADRSGAGRVPCCSRQ